MVMYRAHCQRILDSVVRANFTEVQFLQHLKILLLLLYPLYFIIYNFYYLLTCTIIYLFNLLLFHFIIYLL